MKSRKVAVRKTKILPPIGWREWISLPELDIPRIKVKVDTGARSSALHAFDIRRFERGRRTFVSFKVHPYQRDSARTVSAEAEVVEYRKIRSSGGHVTLRPVILTFVEFMDQSWPIELTLVSRDAMGFRMLLGREAVRGRFVVDAGKSYYGGKPPKVKRKNASAKRKKTTKKRQRSVS